MKAVEPTIAVGLCEDLERQGGLDVGAVLGKLDDLLPGVRVATVPDLCGAPEQLRVLASSAGADRLVLGLCTRDASAEHRLQSWVRRAGLDPFALELVDLGRERIGSSDATGRATSLLLAAVARARAFAGSNPEQLKLRFLPFEQRRSRRSLFALPPTTYRPVPSIDRPRCLGGRRCSLCVPACPVGAIEAKDGSLAIDRDRCESCGLCVTACPAGAIEYPGSSLPQYEAQLAALLAQEPAGILFACGRALAAAETTGGWPLEDGWMPIEVPCMGAVTPGWPLQALAAGAPAVALLSCGEQCRFGRDASPQEGADYARSLLGVLGEEAPAERVVVVPATERERLAQRLPPPRPAGSPRSQGRSQEKRLTLVEPAATAEAVLVLAGRCPAPSNVSLHHAGSPLGRVRIREETCTLCGSCAPPCPTGALAYEEVADAATLSYDASACVACGRCVWACPEAAAETLDVAPVTDLAALSSGRVTLKQDRSTRCRRCGRPVAPAPMLARIRTLLEDEEEAESLLAVVGGMCIDCRALG